MASKAEQLCDTIFRRIRADEQFIHATSESLGIRLPSDGIVRKLAELADDTIHKEAREFIQIAAGFLIVIGREHGLYVKAKKGGMIEICGFYPYPNNPSRQDIMGAMLASENGLEIWANNHRTTLTVSAEDYRDGADEPLQDSFDRLLTAIPEAPRIAMTVGILNAVNEELNQVLDG